VSTTPDAQNQSIGELFTDVTKDVSLLIRQEVELAKAELRETAGTAGKSAGELGAAAVAAHFALLFVTLAVWWAIGDGIGRAWAALIVGAVYAIIATILATIGRRDLKAVTGLPQTTRTMKKIPSAMKGNEDVR